MRVPRVTTRRIASRKMPRTQTSMRAGSSKRAAIRAAKKASSSILNVATVALKTELSKKVNKQDIDALVKTTQSFAEKIKTPTGVLGRNLNLVKMQLLDQPAIGGTTESTSMFSYRPKRTPKTTDTISYTAKRTKKIDITNSDGSQYSDDRNLALLEPPLNDVLSSNTSYTNFSIRNEFDRMLLARVTDQTTEQNTLKQTLTANFHALSSLMILRAPTQGAIVEIFDLQPKFGIGPGTYQNEGYALDHLSPKWCWSTGLSGSGIIETMDDINHNTVGSDPMNSPTFRRTWNIIKKTTVRMTSNSIHRHRFIFNINKSVTYDEMAQCSTSGGTVPWLPTQMVVVRGYPTSTSKAESVTVSCQQESSLSYSSRLAKNTSVIVYNNNT